MKKYKFIGQTDAMKKKVYNILSRTIRLNSHDLYLTNADTTMYTRNGRYLHRLPEFKELSDYVLECAKDHESNIRHVMTWANVYPTGSLIRPHNHTTFKEMLSAVLYLQGEGELHFENSVEKIDEGSIIVFPGVLKHWTGPNESQQDRIIVGFDLYYGDMTEEEFQKELAMHESLIPIVEF